MVHLGLYDLENSFYDFRADLAWSHVAIQGPNAEECPADAVSAMLQKEHNFV